MTPEQIKAIAEAISNHQSQSNLSLLVAWFAATLVASGIGAFAASYLKKRGENYATKQDFKDLLAQLRATTEATTEIKTKIEHDDWRLREYISTKRIKAEALVTELYELPTTLEEVGRRVFFENGADIPMSPAKKCVMLTVLYFPHLSEHAITLGAHGSFMSKILSQFRYDQLMANGDQDLVRKALHIAQDDYLEGQRLTFALCSFIERVVSNELAIISNVEPPYGEHKSPIPEVDKFWQEVGQRIGAD